MHECVESDNKNNSLRKPALQKLLNLDHVTKELRRIPIQNSFIEKAGCDALANWLYPLPDGTFPNVKVVTEILSVIETMSIEMNFLEESKLGRVVRVYAKNKANMPQVLEMAKRILDKWSRMFCGITTSFYDGGRYGDDEDEGATQD